MNRQCVNGRGRANHAHCVWRFFGRNKQQRRRAIPNGGGVEEGYGVGNDTALAEECTLEHHREWAIEHDRLVRGYAAGGLCGPHTGNIPCR